ncbi:uncharacterized protein LOC119664665, partial [Teleopsis dalmanni]|uniref:uncharacterized protein LOC119664665 n=1 Tax=Teleopsis dalmanni TaxID=139649 RepID=UPI0018CDD8D5
RAAGFGYAGAQANPSVGAGAVLGGATDEGGFLGADAYANGKSTSKTVSGFFPPPESYQVPSIFSPNDEIIPTNTGDNVQKIKPPKKYSLFNAELPNQIAECETAVDSSKNQPTTNLQPSDKKLSSITTTKVISTRTYVNDPVSTVHKTANIPKSDDGSVIIVERQKQNLRGRKQQRRRVTKTRQRVVVQQTPDVSYVKLETTEVKESTIYKKKNQLEI